MRQAGIIAAGCLYALENNVNRLADDHTHAERLSQGLNAIAHVKSRADTNMVFMRVDASKIDPLADFLQDRHILIGRQKPMVRLVLHKDIGPNDVDTLIDSVTQFFSIP